MPRRASTSPVQGTDFTVESQPSAKQAVPDFVPFQNLPEERIPPHVRLQLAVVRLYRQGSTEEERVGLAYLATCLNLTAKQVAATVGGQLTARCVRNARRNSRPALATLGERVIADESRTMVRRIETAGYGALLPKSLRIAG